jgi:ketosteroid isomerase-like protein
MTNDEKKVEQIIRDFNRTWTDGRLDDLSVFFDERVVAIAPNGGRVEGREAMVESFRQFLAMARVDDFQVTAVGVDVFDFTAVARFGFVVRYELYGASYDETGSEVLVLVKSDETWRIVWRTQIPVPLS